MFKASSADISAIIKAHFAWKLKIKSAIEGTSDEALDALNIEDDEACALGQWVTSASFSEDIAYDPIFLQLQKKHSEFHQVTSKTAQLNQAGDKNQALAEITSGECAKISREIVNLLSELYKKYK